LYRLFDIVRKKYLLNNMINLHLRKQFFIFIIVGITTVSIDYVSYLFIFYLFDIVILAKMIGYMLGTSFSFLANKKWTFADKGKEYNQVVKFLILYIFTMAVNSAVNTLALEFFSGPSSINKSFVLATMTSAILNFIGMKFYIFTNNNSK